MQRQTLVINRQIQFGILIMDPLYKPAQRERRYSHLLERVARLQPIAQLIFHNPELLEHLLWLPPLQLLLRTGRCGRYR